jgi:putative ABC transport system permease protein
MPDWKQEVRLRLAVLKIDPAREQEIVEELAEHLEDRYTELLSAGASPEYARRAISDELSDGDLLIQGLRRTERRVATEPVILGSSRSRNMTTGLLQDIRYGARTLKKSPGFAAAVVLMLALGIGANTAIFSVVYAVLLRPLPFAEPDRLIFLAEKDLEGELIGIAYPNYEEFRERAGSFAEMAAFLGQSFNLTGLEKPVRLQGRKVSWNFLRLLGVAPQLGRDFVEQDDRPGAVPTALISDGLWNERFGGRSDVLGEPVRIDGQQYTIIGVLPPMFEFIRRGDIFVPLGPSLTEASGLLNRGNHFALFGLARLKEGVSVEQASEEMKTLAAQLEQQYPVTNKGVTATAQELKDFLVEDIRPALVVLLGAVGFVLLIACVNVANLLLVRATRRQKEIALRMALGASRGRIVRQLLSESLLISLLGGGAGLLVGHWAMQGLLSLATPNIPRLDQVGLDTTTLIFTLSVSVLTGLLFGLLPALQSLRTDLQATLKEGGRFAGGAVRERTRKVLLVAEVALALVLLIGAGLMLRTVFQLTHVDMGFKTENLLSMRFILSGDAYNPERRRAFSSECLAQLEATPGVESAALTLSLPLFQGSGWQSVFITGDKSVPESKDLPSAAFTPVSSNYFDVMGIRLLAGRMFNEADTATSTPVVVVNQTLARRLWPGEDPVGKRLKQGFAEDKTPWREVMGVVSDVRQNGIDRDPPMQVYIPLQQEPMRSLIVVARTAGDPLAMASMIEERIHSIDKDLPVFNVRTMDQLLDESIAQQQLAMALLGGFALLALMLAAMGIYGVMSYAVTQRTHEIGVRMAMGAQPSDVLRLVVGQGLTLALIGVAVGISAALAMTRLMASMLFGVSSTDPLTFISISLLLIAVAALACYVPARRAARVDPMVALRYE